MSKARVTQFTLTQSDSVSDGPCFILTAKGTDSSGKSFKISVSVPSADLRPVSLANTLGKLGAALRRIPD